MLCQLQDGQIWNWIYPYHSIAILHTHIYIYDFSVPLCGRCTLYDNLRCADSIYLRFSYSRIHQADTPLAVGYRELRCSKIGSISCVYPSGGGISYSCYSEGWSFEGYYQGVLGVPYANSYQSIGLGTRNNQLFLASTSSSKENKRCSFRLAKPEKPQFTMRK